MIDVNEEDIISIPQSCREPAFKDPKTGGPCHVSAVYRYITRGARAANGQRVRLETIKTPRGLATSRQAIQRLIERLTDPDAFGGDAPNAGSVAPTSASRRRAAARVDSELDACGIK
jgi:hypothetical protein